MVRTLFKTLLLSFVAAFSGLPEGNAQVPIGSWQDHFPYNHCISATHSRNKAYAATENGIIVHSSSDNSVEKLNKINALSDIGINTIRYHRELGLLVVGYKDGGLDILSQDRTWAINDIENSSILASKSIDHILFHGDRAYLSCGFGIVLINLPEKQVQESYMIGNNSMAVDVRASTIHRDSIFAATASGLFKASLNSPNLSDFQNWTKTSPGGLAGPFEDIVSFDDRLFLLHKPNPANVRDSVLQYGNGQWSGFGFKPRSRDITDLQGSEGRLIISQNGAVMAFDKNDSLIDNIHGHPWTGNPFPQEAFYWKGKYWFADRKQGLLGMQNPWNGERILPDGPETTNNFRMRARGDQLWIATGTVTNNWDPLYQNQGVLQFSKNDWTSFNSSSQAAFDTLFDPISVAIDPRDPEHVFIGTWGNGLIELQDGRIQKIHDASNSTLNEHPSIQGIVACWGASFDENGNLWVTNSFSNEPVSVLTTDDQWHSLGFQGSFGSTDRYGPILCTSTGQKWVILPGSDGILVFDTKGTPGDPSDDEFKILNNNAGSGGFPSNRVLSMAEDKDQEIWVGTDKGVGVFYTPDDLFSQNPSDAEEILVDYDGFLEPLLDNEEVTTITVDGADQKWVGTSNSGVFHLSPNGKEELHRFSRSNSPLIADGINDIAVHPNTGEVFFGTDQGIVSYRAQATEGKQQLDEIVIYPNPVHKDHTGPVAIRGLPANSSFRITDVNGDVVHRGRSKGGQAVWDGTDTEGIRVRTGVYLVFVASPNGEQSMAGKIMFFH